MLDLIFILYSSTTPLEWNSDHHLFFLSLGISSGPTLKAAIFTGIVLIRCVCGMLFPSLEDLDLRTIHLL